MRSTELIANIIPANVHVILLEAHAASSNIRCET